MLKELIEITFKILLFSRDFSSEPFVYHGYPVSPKATTLSNNGHTVQMGMELHRGQTMPSVSSRCKKYCPTSTIFNI